MSGTNASYGNAGPSGNSGVVGRPNKPGMDPAMGRGGGALNPQMMELIKMWNEMERQTGKGDWGGAVATIPGMLGWNAGGTPANFDPGMISEKEGVGKVKANRRAKNRKNAVIKEVSGDGSKLYESATGKSKIKPTVSPGNEPPTKPAPKKKPTGRRLNKSQMEY